MAFESEDVSYIAAAAAKSLQSCPTLYNPIDGSPPASPVPGILQARTLEWVAISFSNAWKWKVKVKLLSCVRLLVTMAMDCSLPGSSIYGIFQARVLEGVAIAFSKLYWVTCIRMAAVDELLGVIWFRRERSDSCPERSSFGDCEHSLASCGSGVSV